MRRLLILCEYPTLLGGERSMLATLPAVAAAGFDVHIAAPHSGPLAEAIRAAGVAHVPWHTHDSRGERLWLAQLRTDLADLMGHFRPQLVHANSLSTSRISGPVVAELGMPSVGHLRDIVRVSGQAVRDIDQHRRIVAVSQATRDFHVARGLTAEKCVVSHNGVDLDLFRPRQPTGYLHHELKLPATAQLIATVGQIGLRKGTDVLIAAAQQVAADVPNAHWLIIGERTSSKDESREFEASLRAKAERMPLKGRVHFLGRRDDMATLLAECTLLVHAARQEPLGRILLESAASGLPIVATDVGGTREIFPPESEAACLISADDVSALRAAMCMLLAHEDRRRALGVAARRRAVQQFDVCHAASRLIDIYESVI
jgi:glycosyltransferase involved in cell wall biosynthesis